MRIVFCKISAMKYYKGACDNDIPFNGGEYVKENGKGHEEYNFDPVFLDDDNSYCLGFVETKSNRGKRNQFHIENISGCSLAKYEESVDDVLVVWCATTDRNVISVVGWYKNATVYRYYNNTTVYRSDKKKNCSQDYNVIAKTKDCVLLPYSARYSMCWRIPGFGQSMIWYANDDNANNLIKELKLSIDNYNGENNVDKHLDELIKNEKQKRIKI